MKRAEGMPWWLARMDLVKAEFRGMRFPRTAEEGVKQCAELSAASMELLRQEIRKDLSARDEGRVEMAVRHLMTRLDRIDERWKAAGGKELVIPEKP